MLRILVADPYPIVTKGIASLARGHSDWIIVGEVQDAQEAQSRVQAERPDVVVLDTSLAKVTDITAVVEPGDLTHGPRVLVHTIRSDYNAISDAVSNGARGYVLKAESTDCLEAGISALGRRQPYFSPAVAAILFAVDDRDPFNFTRRELQIAQLIADGLSNKHMARRLELSVKTIESHRASAMRKAGTNTAADFVRFVVKENLVAA